MKEIYSAFVKCQSEIQENSVKKTTQAYNYKYADLRNVWEAIREPLKNNNLAIYQGVSGTRDDLRLVTTVTHISGESISDGGVPLILKNKCMQGLGSAITYGRRYGLLSMLGVSPENDDDGVAAGLENKQKTKFNPKVTRTNTLPEDEFL